MPVQTSRDPLLTQEALRSWLDASSVTLIEGHTTTGYSNETLLFDATFNDRVEKLVARVQPTSNTIFLNPDFEAEHRVMELVRKHGVRAPRLLGYEKDPSVLGAAFFVAERIEGLVPPDNPPYTFGGWVTDCTASQRTMIWKNGLQAMIDVHRAPLDEFEFLHKKEYGKPGIEEQLNYALAMYDWIGDSTNITEEAIEWMKSNLPTDETLALCWGDSRIGNQIFKDFEVVAVLDWEMAAIADPEMDLAWFSYLDRVFTEGFGLPRLDGIPSRDETNSLYEQITGHRVINARFYEVFSAFRFAIIMMRIGQLMIGSGALPADSDFGKQNFAMDTLARVLKEAGH
ncbi:MAG: phosphotransferase family protein [Actinomycetota bacterium]